MKTDELAEHLNSLKREECYRVDAVLKESPFETTQRVTFIGANGAEQGPYIRKYIKRDVGMGSAYARIFEAQQGGKRFRFIPRIIDCYDFDDMHVVVMEYVRGETLAEVIYRCDPSMLLAVDVFCRLCDAASELHEEFDPPIIHRDLKPSNVILSRDNLTIIDFGIARAFREDADADTVRFGTRAYAPPEQFGYHQTDVRSDVYALGMLLCYCLTERTPDAHVREACFADARIPASVREVLLRATAFDPENRYTSARELKQAFLEAVSDEDTLAKDAWFPTTGVHVWAVQNSHAAGEDNVGGEEISSKSELAPERDDNRQVSSGEPTLPPFTFPKYNKSKRKPLKHREAKTAEVKQVSSARRSWESCKEQASHMLQKFIRRLFSISVPLWLGVIWDMLLVFVSVMFGMLGIDLLILNPTGEYAMYPLWYNAIVCVGFIVIFAGPCFAFLDKRLIVRVIPALRKVQGIKGVLASLGISLAIFVLVVTVCVIALLVIDPTL